MSKDSQETLFERNCRFFKAVSPGIFAAIRAKDDASADKNIRNDPLDLGTAITLERFFWRPMPIQIKVGQPPEHHLFLDFSKELYRELAGLKLSQMPRPDGGFLFLFGVPQGNELESLLRRTPAKTLILAESDADAFFRPSHRVDWQVLTDLLKSRGGRIRFVVGTEAAQLASAVQAACLDRNFAWLDGSYHGIGRKVALHERAYELFVHQLPNLQSSAGFFEDELRMLQNTIANVQAGGNRSLFSPNDARPASGAALVIASGPSASEKLAMIRRLWGEARPPVPVITAGTGLALARRYGIQPDYHCEIENVSDILDGLIATLGEDGMFQSVLVAPTSISPKIPPLFAECLHFLRGFGTASSLFSESTVPLDNSSPTVTNLAVRFASLLGVKEIVLIGADFGTQDREKHHAAGSIYDQAREKGLPASFSSDIAPFEIPVKAVDGTRFLTNQILMQSAQQLGVFAAQTPGLRVIRAGNGAAIPNVGQFSDKEFENWLDRELSIPSRSGLLGTTVQSQFQPARFKSVSDWAEKIFDASQDFDGSIDRLCEDVMSRYFKADEDPRNVVLLFGTVTLCFQLGIYLHNRVFDKDKSVIDQVFCRLFRKLLYSADREWTGFKRQHNL